MTSNPFQYFDFKTLHDDVADVIRRAILHGDIAPGEKINQAQIAQELGTSRGPVREGLKQLREEGLVHEIPYKGTYVINITLTYIKELYEIRRNLEGFAVRCAIDRAEPEDLEKLRVVVDKMQQTNPSLEFDQSTDLDLSFHRLIFEAAHNGILLRIWNSIGAGVRLCLAHRHRAYRNLRKHLDAHSEILMAIETKNSEEAAQLLDAHIAAAGEAMYQAWSASLKQESVGV